MMNDIQQILMTKHNISPSDKSARMSLSAAVKSFTCRVVEEANSIRDAKEDNGGPEIFGRIDVHNTHDYPEWAPSCRGAGIVYTKDAEDLLSEAIGAVSDKCV